MNNEHMNMLMMLTLFAFIFHFYSSTDAGDDSGELDFSGLLKKR